MQEAVQTWLTVVHSRDFARPPFDDPDDIGADCKLDYIDEGIQTVKAESGGA